MTRTLLGAGTTGEFVKQLQRALTAQGCAVRADGMYGQQTCAAVCLFQSRNALPATGTVGEETWSALTGRPVPSVGERCLHLTAAFEGHGFESAKGNFDGALLTWGIVGFTMKAGEIQKIVTAIAHKCPELLQRAFGERREELVRLMNESYAYQERWANSATQKDGSLTEPWRTMFANFGAMKEVQAEQVQRAKEDYLEPAIGTAKKTGFKSELGLALCFDIHVQNGGIGAGLLRTIIREFQSGMKELDRRVAVANAVAQSAGTKWREDVRSRKLTAATGEGVVHGRRYFLENWGLADIEAEELGEHYSVPCTH